MRVLVIGELNPDLILRGYQIFPTLGKEVLVDDLFLTLGSSSAICAHGIRRLGNTVSFIGKVGCDTWGDFCIRTINEAGLDASMVIRDSTVKTGITVSITGGSDRALVTYLGAMSELRAAEISHSILDRFDHLHVSSFFLQRGLRDGLRDLFVAARKKGLVTSIDPGYDPTEEWSGALRELLREVDIFLPNEVELRGITGCDDPDDGLRALADTGALIVAKLGAAGCKVIVNGEHLHVPVLPVKVVDTTGAGDSFNAGFLHAWLRKAPLRDALRFGVACGALSTTGMGGIAAQPSEQEALQFLRDHGQDEIRFGLRDQV